MARKSEAFERTRQIYIQQRGSLSPEKWRRRIKKEIFDLGLLEYIALYDKFWKARFEATKKINNEPLLKKIARKDKYWSVRLVALRIIKDQEFLEEQYLLETDRKIKCRLLRLIDHTETLLYLILNEEDPEYNEEAYKRIYRAKEFDNASYDEKIDALVRGIIKTGFTEPYFNKFNHHIDTAYYHWSFPDYDQAWSAGIEIAKHSLRYIYAYYLLGNLQKARSTSKLEFMYNLLEMPDRGYSYLPINDIKKATLYTDVLEDQIAREIIALEVDPKYSKNKNLYLISRKLGPLLKNLFNWTPQDQIMQEIIKDVIGNSIRMTNGIADTAEQDIHIDQYILEFKMLNNLSLEKKRIKNSEDGYHIDLSKLGMKDPSTLVIPQTLRDQIIWLDLSLNNVEFLPAGIYKLSNLRTLDISNNQIRFLTPEITALENLEHLIIKNNGLIALPNQISKLKKLKEIWADGNNLVILPPEIGKLANLEALWLNNNNIYALPDAIGELGNLRWLELKNNALKSLPDSMCKLSNLGKFIASNNQITELPHNIGKLRNLSSFEFSSNRIEKIPESIVNLKNLCWLRLRDNRLQELPENLAGLKNLRNLDLFINKIQRLPDQLFKLGKLEYLNLSRNSLEKISEDIVNLRKLRILTLGHNKDLEIGEELIEVFHVMIKRGCNIIDHSKERVTF